MNDEDPGPQTFTKAISTAHGLNSRNNRGCLMTAAIRRWERVRANPAETHAAEREQRGRARWGGAALSERVGEQMPENV